MASENTHYTKTLPYLDKDEVEEYKQWGDKTLLF